MGRSLATLLALGLALAMHAHAALTYSQLRQFVQSSVDQKLKDKDIANYLKGQTVGFAITDELIEEFVGWGIGPRTLRSLEALKTKTASLPKPETAATKKQVRKQPPPPSEEERLRIIEDARGLSQAYSTDLPNYVCLQVTRRYFDPTGTEMDWLKHDEIKTRVSYVDGREDYETLTINDAATTKGFQDLGGTVSTGEFGTILDSLFDEATAAEFNWARYALLRGRPAYAFQFKVPRHRSNWTLTSDGRSGGDKLHRIRTGYEGLVYVDRDSGRVLRIDMKAVSIPSDFPMQEARSRLDFDFIEISDQEFLLPLKAQAYIRSGRLLTRNDLEFRLYRKFTAEATISFEEIEGLEPLPEDDISE